MKSPQDDISAPTTALPKITFGYIRTSTNRQDLSVEVQTERIKRAAEYHNTGNILYFSAPDTSGRIPFLERQGETAEMVERTKELRDKYDITLMVPKVDRLGRDSIDVNQTVRLFDDLGVRIVFLDLNVDTRSAIGRAFLQIAATFAELEVATIRERIKSALDQKRSHGQLTGSIPFGWNAEPTGELNKKGKPIFRITDNPEQQQWILQMIQWQESGMSAWQIARELNQAGVQTKRAGERLTVVCDPDTPGARPNKRGQGFVVDKPASGRWQAEQVTTLLASQTVKTWLAQRAKE